MEKLNRYFCLLAVNIPAVITGCFWLVSLTSCVFYWMELTLQPLGCRIEEFGALLCFDTTGPGHILNMAINFWWFGYFLFGVVLFEGLPPALMLVFAILVWGTGILLAIAVRRIVLRIRQARV